MGWVKVHYSKQRGVFVDGQELGNTNKLIYVGVDGTHDFDLDAPVDYKPVSMRRRVVNTTRKRPLELTFKPRSGA